jgi:uncharacterized protein YtpQ (UPF0354 family)
VALFSRLSAWLGSTKPKATRFGGIAQFREHVIAAARKQLEVDSIVADPADPAKFKVTKGEWSSIDDVTNLFTYLEACPDDDIEEPVRRFVNSIAESIERSIDESNIVAVIRHRNYVEANAEWDILHEPLDPDLVIMYMADRPDSMASVKATDLPGKDLTTIRQIALNNVRRWLPRVTSNDELGAGVLYCVEDNPMLAPSLILLDEFWTSVAARFPGDVLIALPRKDQLFVFDDDDPVAEAMARRLTAASIEEGYNLLTSNLYARRAGKIVAVPHWAGPPGAVRTRLL